MASKKDMLKQGATKTGTGLFQGMKRLDDRDDEVLEEVKETRESDKTTETVNNNAFPKESPIETAKTVAVKPEVVAEREITEEKPKRVTAEASLEEIVNSVKEPKKPEKEVSEEVYNKGSFADSAEEYEINSSLNKTSKSAENKESNSSKANSRYEKDKFLLLDIRGYRDYVEHMAKAANMSATKYIRNLIDQDMEKNRDIYEAHKALEEKLRMRSGN